MKFDDLKISTKVALPAIVLTVVALVIVGLGAFQARKTEANTKTLVEQRAPAELAAARFNRRVSTIGYAAYRSVAYTGASAEAQAASGEIDAAYKEGKTFLAVVKKTDPGSGKQVADFQSRLDKIYSSARQGADLGMQDADEAAIMVMAVIDPDIAALTKDVNKFVEGHSAETNAMVEKASKEA